MKKLIHPVTITIVVVFILLALPFVLPDREMQKYSDDELREVALSRGMKPTPKTYEELLKVVDNPENPMTKEKIALGTELFFDTILSKDRDINCASCHILEQGGDDNLPTAIGYNRLKNPFHLNSPTVLNAALAKSQFWNGSAKDVEAQAGGPIQAPFEMNMSPKEVVERLKKSASYVEKFKNVFGEINFENVRKAIGAYERTLLTRGDYDRFLDGNNSAINEKAKKGFAHFINYGCKGCHTGMSVGGQSIQKFPLRKVASIYDIRWIDNSFPFENIGGFLGKDNSKLFRVPILRNISKTAPYFHNGAVKELEKVVDIMGMHQIGVKLTKEEIEEIVEFLKTLDGEIIEYNIK